MRGAAHHLARRAARIPADDLARRAARTPAADLARGAARTPAATALSWDGGRWSYRELDARASVLAARLPRMGAVPSHPVTLCAQPGPEAVAALFAIWKAGCMAAPLHERLAPAEIARARRTARPALHLDDEALRSAPHAAAPPAAQHAAAPPAPAPAPAPAPNPPSPYADFPDLAALVLTSGTSGAPKAVGFTGAALSASAAAAAEHLSLSATDRWGLCLSLGHIGGLSLVARAAALGSSVRLWPRFDPAAVIRAALDGQVTHLAVVPVMLRRLLAELRGRTVPHTLRCILVGGAAAPTALLEEAWSAGLPAAPTWGMTETASQIATALPALTRRRPGAAGRPLPGVEVRAAANRRLHVRGPTLASAVVPGPNQPPRPLPTDADGWFETPDLGRVDPDGLVWIEGRADAIIVSGGLNVSPAEVERAIESLPGVREAVVFGVPDDEWGEVVAAVVECDPGAVTASGVDRHCRERLGPGRRPTRIAVVDSLPRTHTGKAAWALVRARHGPELASAGATQRNGGDAGETG